MKKMKPLRHTRLASLLLCVTAASHAALPDAGQLLRQETERDKAAAPALPPVQPAATQDDAVSDTGPKVQVNSFRLVGLQALSDAKVQAMLAPFLGQQLGMNGLHRVAEKLEQWLRVSGRQISATLANRLNDNPARDANGRDSDNQSIQPRLWLQASVAF